MFTTLSVTKDYLLCKRRLVPRNVEEEENMEGKIVIVTGANSGIGKCTALEIAKKGATVIMACRDLTKSQEVVDELKTKIDNDKGQLVLMELDLGDLSSVQKFAAEFKSKYSCLNVLINNAGVSDQNGVLFKTKDGFESHIGVNHLGPFLLTLLLLDHLVKGRPSRIVTVSSSLYVFSDLKIDDLMMEKATSHGFGNLYPYCNSKLANLLFNKELGKKLAGTGVTSYALCPGLVDTNVFRTEPRFKHFFTKTGIKLMGFSPEQGCNTTLYCVMNKNIAQDTGKTYRFGKAWECVVGQPLDEDLCSQLWKKSEEIVGITMPVLKSK
jgi:NAD(P)-dependent dehydrogenase (short-subunit alcohol dehydrogenase family)